MSNTFVFTEIFNCAPIGEVALRSYHEHHDYPVHVFGTPEDLAYLPEEIQFHRNTIIYPISSGEIVNKFKRGHEGTAFLMARVSKKQFGDYTRFIRFDSDIYFKKECLSIVEKAFDEGYDIIGTRRCYGNNPGGVPDLHNYPDTISTYFMGMHLDKFPDYNLEYLARMWQGAVHPLGYPTLDFADPVAHVMLANGAKLKYLDWNEFGSQDINGKKNNNYKSNMHMDTGSHLIHWGGVGSGYTAHHKLADIPQQYGEWAIGRYALFQKVFYSEEIDYHAPTQYCGGGRWCFGTYDENILNTVLSEMEN